MFRVHALACFLSTVRQTKVWTLNIDETVFSKTLKTSSVGKTIKLIALLSALVFNATQDTTAQTASSGAPQTRTTTRTAATLAGRIVDQSDAGIAGATVTIFARDDTAFKQSTTTDQTGVYRFQNLAAAHYIIEVTAAGFTRAQTEDLRVETGTTEIAFRDLRLAVAGVREEVSVTASGTPQAVDELSKAVTVIDARELQERDEITVSDALRTVPGLRVQQLGGAGRVTSVRTRGLRPQDTAVLIDGIRLRDASAPQNEPSAFLGDLLVTNLDQVEVLRGSGSSLYGTNAVGGAINLVTDAGGGRTRGSLLAEGGSPGLFRGRAQVAGGALGDRFVYSAGLTHFNTARGIDGDDAARNTSGQGRVGFRLTPRTNISGRILASDAFTQLNESPDVIAGAATDASGIVRARPLRASERRRLEAGTPLNQINFDAATFIPDLNDADFRQASRIFAGALFLTHRFSETANLTVSYQGLFSGRRTRNGTAGRAFQPVGGETENINRGRIHTLNARVDFAVGQSNLITAGYEFEDETFRGRSLPVNPASSFSTDVTQRSNAFFVQDQLNFFEERLQLSAAFRAQFFSLRTPRFTAQMGQTAASNPYRDISFVDPPNAYTGDGSVAYLVSRRDNSSTKLRAHVGNSYRAPSLFERFGASTFGALGDPRLRPERAISFDVGIDQSFARNRARLSATYFYARLQEVVGFGSTVQPDPFGRRFGGYVNTGGGLARGAEVSATLAPTNSTDIFTSYTRTNSDDRLPKLGSIIRAYIVPDQQFSAVVTQRLPRRVMLNFDLLATSDYLAPVFASNFLVPSRVYRFDGIVKADFGASYTLPLAETRSFKFFGRIENLFDRDNFESGFQNPGRTARAGAMFSF